MADIDVAIVGGGVMGACAAWHLAGRGHDVHVFEQFARDHAHGSSHGTARIFRLAYPDPEYVAMARAALPLWDQLEEQSGRSLRTRCGALDHGDPAEVQAIAANLADAGIAHERVTAAEVAARWPGLRGDRDAVFHPAGGTVDAGATVAAALDAAAALGAILHHVSPVHGLQVRGDHVVVTTPDGRYSARRVVVTAGAWVGRVVAGLAGGTATDLRADTPVEAAHTTSDSPSPPAASSRSALSPSFVPPFASSGPGVALPPMVVTREQPVHFDRVDDLVRGRDDEPWPAFIHWSHAGPPRTSGVAEPLWAYGLPSPDGRIKVGEHHTGTVVAAIPGRPRPGEVADPSGRPEVHLPVAPSTGGAVVDRASLARLQDYAAQWVPGVDPATAEPEHCLYTTTPSTDFVLDRVGPIVVGGGFSGHGFKFAPHLGAVLADLATDGPRPGRRFHLPT